MNKIKVGDIAIGKVFIGAEQFMGGGMMPMLVTLSLMIVILDLL